MITGHRSPAGYDLHLGGRRVGHRDTTYVNIIERTRDVKQSVDTRLLTLKKNLLA